MNVCHIWQNFFPIESGGVERYILNLSDHLSAQDSSMRFLLLTDKSNICHRIRRRLPKQEKINSVQVHRLGPNSYSYARNLSYKLTHRKFKSLEALFEQSLFREAKNLPDTENVKIFQLHGIWEPLYATFALHLSKHYGRPLLVSLHGDSFDQQDPFAMKLNNSQVIEALKQASVITTFSKGTRQLLAKLGLGKKTVLVPNFINTASFTNPYPKTQNAGNRVVMVSRLDENKNPAIVIRAFHQAKKIVPDATLTIQGYGPLYDSVTNLIKELDLENSVTIVDRKQDVRKVLWNSDIFVATKSSYVACLEAWAAGLAVIAPRFGVLNEAVSDGCNGLLVEAGQDSQLAAALVTLLQNRPLQEKIAANGKKIAVTHDVSTVGKRIQDLYDSLI